MQSISKEPGAPGCSETGFNLPSLSRVFREFISELEGNAVKITDTNFTGLQRLCEEFSFDEFAAKLSEFPAIDGLPRIRGCGCTRANRSA
jgi:hypothetical protein